MKNQYSNNPVGLTEHFDPAAYTSVIDEVCLINEKTATVPIHFKAEIIISFLKDHCLEVNWMNVNPELTALVTSHALFTGSIESLFESSRNNHSFRQGLEKYLKENLAGCVRP